MTDKILNPYEVETNIHYQESLKDCLNPQQASDYLDGCFDEIASAYGGLFNRLPEYAPVWLSGLINCVPSVAIPLLGGSKHYWEADLKAFFYQSYSPSVLSSHEW
jgi:hypothetical protein